MCRTKKAIKICAITLSIAACISGCGDKQEDTSVSDIQARGVMKVAVPDHDTSLLYYDNEALAYRGAEAELIDILSQSMGVPAEYVVVSDDQLINSLAVGGADIAIGYIDEQSAELSDYAKTISYGGEDLFVVSPRGMYVGSLTVLKDSTVGVSSRIDSHAYNEVYYSGAANVVVYSDSQSVLSAFQNDDIEGYICYRSEAEFLVESGELQVQSCRDLQRENFVIAMLPGKNLLLSGCNSLIEAYLSGDAVACWNQVKDVPEEEVHSESLFENE